MHHLQPLTDGGTTRSTRDAHYGCKGTRAYAPDMQVCDASVTFSLHLLTDLVLQVLIDNISFLGRSRMDNLLKAHI
jgi:hypothetical protein